MNFSYTSEDLNAQFPAQQNFSDGKKGVQFKTSAVMAYQQDSLGSSCITAATDGENKLYYRRDESQAKLSYDSYNISSKDGNTSQLGINGRENNDQPMEIRSRALFDASAVSGLNLTNESDAQYPVHCIRCTVSGALYPVHWEISACHSRRDVLYSFYFNVYNIYFVCMIYQIGMAGR